MSEYKRKKVKKSLFKKNGRIKAPKNDDIFIDKDEEEKPKTQKRKKAKSDFFSSFKVIENKKTVKRGKLFKAAVAVLIIAAIVVLTSLISPTGIIEGASNLINSFGGGDYPVSYNGSLTVDSVQNGLYYYVLNDTSISAFNTSGKEIFTHIHGFSNPVMSFSSERAIVFDQNGTALNVYNLSGLVDSISTKYKIINASVCRNGSYAVSTIGGEYTSVVTVYNKNGKKLYTWNSAKDIANNVALSSNGKKLAVSLLSVLGGQPVSKVSVFEYDSANPVFSCDLGDKTVYQIRSVSNGFGCVTDSVYSYFTWRKFEKTDYSVNDKQISQIRGYGNDTVLVFNRESDRSDNKIIYFSSGKKKGEFNYKGNITDIQFKGGRIFIVSDTKISVYNKDGELKVSGSCDYGIKRFAIISSDKIAAITDDSIKEYTVQ